MTWLVPLALLAVSTVALADPPPKPVAVKRKPASDKYTPDALSKFVDAIIEDKSGDLSSAAHKYRDSLRDAPQANTYYNLANVEHRLEWYEQAIKSYRKYLELSPEASDRKEVERLIQSIETMPPIAIIEGDDAGAVVLVDGKLVGPSPALIYPTEDGHVAERIGPASYAHDWFFIPSTRPRTEHVRMKYVEAPGNVVLSTSQNLRLKEKWEQDGRAFQVPGRVALPPGHYELELPHDRACSKIVFDVAKGDHVTHVFIDTPWRPGDASYGCKKITVKTQKVVLP